MVYKRDQTNESTISKKKKKYTHLLLVATVGAAELEGPEEVGDLLEVGTDGVDLVDDILNADNAELSEAVLDDLVVCAHKIVLDFSNRLPVA